MVIEAGPVYVPAFSVIEGNGGRSRGVWCRTQHGRLICLVDAAWVGGDGARAVYSGWPACGWTGEVLAGAIAGVSVMHGTAVRGWVKAGYLVTRECLWSQADAVIGTEEVGIIRSAVRGAFGAQVAPRKKRARARARARARRKKK